MNVCNLLNASLVISGPKLIQPCHHNHKTMIYFTTKLIDLTTLLIKYGVSGQMDQLWVKKVLNYFHSLTLALETQAV